MSAISISEDSDSCLTFSSRNPAKELRVNYKFKTNNPNDATLLPLIIESQLFSDYLGLFAKSKSLNLNLITFLNVNMRDIEVVSLKISVECSDKDGGVIPPYLVDLEGSSVAVLILLRVAESAKDTCVFVKLPRPNVGASDFLELPEGKFDETGKFTGEAADLIADVFELPINQKNLIDLTERAFGLESRGISTCQNSDARFSLFLLRQNVTPAKLAEYEERCNKKRMGITNGVLSRHNKREFNEDGGAEVEQESDLTCSNLQLRLIPLGDAWRATTDCKAIIGIFLVHELRYHKLMPKFRPNENGIVGKMSAQFTKIGSLEPMSSGVNLRGKVVSPLQLLPDKTRRDGKLVKEGIMVIGDEEGTINLKLSSDQFNVKNETDAPLVIRNAKVSMENGHMMLVVNRWGKIECSISEQDEEHFNFSVLRSNHVSATEFELVVLDNEESENNMSPEHTDDRRPSSRGKYVGSRRGSGGVRGGRWGRERKPEMGYPRGGRQEVSVGGRSGALGRGSGGR